MQMPGGGPLIHQQERFFGEGDASFHEYMPPRPTLIRNRRPLPFQQKNRMKRGWRRGPGGDMPFLMQGPPVLPPHMIPIVPHPLPPHLASGFPPNMFPPPHFVPITASDPSLLYSLSLGEPIRQPGHFSMSGEHRARQGGFTHTPPHQPQDRNDSGSQKDPQKSEK